MNHLYQDSPIYSHALCVTCSKLEAMKGWGLILWVKIRIAVSPLWVFVAEWNLVWVHNNLNSNNQYYSWDLWAFFRISLIKGRR